MGIPEDIPISWSPAKRGKKPNNQAVFLVLLCILMSTDGTGKNSARNLYRHNSFTSRASMPELQGRRYLHFRTSSEPISPLSICFCERERQREKGPLVVVRFSILNTVL
jgi:hypothetical protein